jgi:hypothetical protein
MRDVHLRQVDLNLFSTLYALLKERHVTFFDIANDGVGRSTIREQSASKRSADFSGDTSDSVHSGPP